MVRWAGRSSGRRTSRRVPSTSGRATRSGRPIRGGNTSSPRGSDRSSRVWTGTYESSQIVSGTSTAYNYLLAAHSLFNGRVTYENTGHAFSVALGVTNLFNKFYYVNVFDYQPLGYPQTDAQPAQPREWYLTVSKRF